jgi:RimJ/RimL family protein N-acetyltransferase
VICRGRSLGDKVAGGDGVAMAVERDGAVIGGITIDPAAANQRAIRCYSAVGFRPVGVMRRYERGADGSFHDGLLMELVHADQ